MFKTALYISCTVLVAVGVGPLTFLATQTGRIDDSDLYIMVDNHFSDGIPQEVLSFGARQIGPPVGMIGRLVFAEPAAHAAIANSGYLILPAGAVAAICGNETLQNFNSPRS